MKLSDEDKLGLSPDEIKALEQAEEGEGDGVLKLDGEPVKDDGATGTTTTTTATAAVEGEGEGDGGELDEDDLDLLDEEDGASAREVVAQPAKFEVDARDFKAELAQLRTDRAAVEEKWTAGEIDDAARNEQLAKLEEQRDNLLIEQTRAQTLLEINQQNEANALARVQEAENKAIIALIESDAKAGDSSLNYKTDVSAQKDFDVALTAIKASATHADKSPAEHVAAAHRMVLSMRGIAAPAPAQAAPTPPAKPVRRDVPLSLGGLPDAGRAAGGVNDEAYAKFSTLQGEAAERFLAGLSEAEVDRLTKLADSKMFSS
jgi:hypothetical protein